MTKNRKIALKLMGRMEMGCMKAIFTKSRSAQEELELFNAITVALDEAERKVNYEKRQNDMVDSK